KVTDFKELDLRSPRESVLIGGLPFEVTDMDTAVRDVITIATESSDQSLVVRLSNAYCVALASQDQEYRQLFGGPGLTLPDGAPVAWAMRNRARHPQKVGRVRGPSFFVGVLDHGRSSGLRHFMLGATDDTLTKLVDETTTRYPGVNIVDAYAPPFGPVEETVNDECIERIARAKPDIVWIGLGTPKQDFAAAALAERLPGVFVGVGAAFDFVAGSVREAPKWVQNSGFEWAYRLMSEPRRLWRRYLFGNARFILAVLRGR
ncbi:MAG: N-acetylglucosaminyldiphosphoundecaprenol N-acetyl-beta-D-mannosaminyltransferase, partial [Mycobacterium sp.]|nr:N-acetylglucosaminyldiphosphoundecaprenol N-acetyl-beta-D-mannosaminyltransferase [Mycobacterium sp.]